MCSRISRWKVNWKKQGPARGILLKIGGVLFLTFAGIVFAASIIGKRDGKEAQDRLQQEILGQSVRYEVIKEEDSRQPQLSLETEERYGEQTNTAASAAGEAAEEAVDLQRVLAEMKGYWEAGNLEAVRELAHLPRYTETSSRLSGSDRYYYMGETDAQNRPHGMGLAIYADHQYYYGSWKDGLRDGDGMWIKYYIYGEAGPGEADVYRMHSYSGQWKGDLPHGEGAQHYELLEEHLREPEGYNRNFIGTFAQGYYHGEMYVTNYYRNGNVKEWTGDAVHGVWKPMGQKDKEGRYPVLVDVKDEDNYQWIHEQDNKNAGVTGLISSVKNRDEVCR